MKIDQLMLDAYLGKSVFGVYDTVVKLSEGWYFIPMAIVTALFPAIMNARRDDSARYRRRLQHLYELMTVVSVAIAVVTTLAAPFIYRTFYSAEYAAGATRSEESRVGKECGRTCRSRWAPDQKKKKKNRA